MAIATGRKQEGAQSATYYFTSSGSLGGSVVDGVNTDWDALPSGKLKDVLNRTYVAADGDTARRVFAAAWAAAGGSAVSNAVAGAAAAAPYWDLSEDDYPVVTYVVPDSGALALRIAVSYSASE